MHFTGTESLGIAFFHQFLKCLNVFKHVMVLCMYELVFESMHIYAYIGLNLCIYKCTYVSVLKGSRSKRGYPPSSKTLVSYSILHLQELGFLSKIADSRTRTGWVRDKRETEERVFKR